MGDSARGREQGRFAAEPCEVLIDTHVSAQGLTMDEASLTGESDPMKKNTTDDPWVMSGTQVSRGMLVQRADLLLVHLAPCTVVTRWFMPCANFHKPRVCVMAQSNSP